MKVHKFEVFIVDFDDSSVNDYKAALEQLRIGMTIPFHVSTVDVEFDDDHPLNMIEVSQDTCNSYFK